MCSNCRIEDRAVLKDCIIGADMIINKDGMPGSLIRLLIYVFLCSQLIIVARFWQKRMN